MRALLSVYDKSGLIDLAAGLRSLGWELVASGGTSKALTDAGIEHLDVPDVTGIPEMLEGRVKTLHPAVHGGILADRSKPEHMDDIEAQGIAPIDLVVCNLYPFEAEPSTEMIDVGGPTMVRAAAKNHAHVAVVVDPSDYGAILEELSEHGRLSDETRARLARAAFAHTASYDASITKWFDSLQPDGSSARESTEGVRESGQAKMLSDIDLSLELVRELRYGENPHQLGGFYRMKGAGTWWDGVSQHGGSELSYLNVFDTDGAWRLLSELRRLGAAAAAIVKHANPCGAAVHEHLEDAYRNALGGDPVSAFGGVVALGGRCTREVALAMADGPQADVIVADSWDDEAIDIMRAKRKATRLLAASSPAAPAPPAGVEIRTEGGGFLVQQPDRFDSPRRSWRVATKVAPDERQWGDLELAWVLCARTSSNAVVLTRERRAAGVGAGQQSRVDAAELAVRKAGERARGAAAASDAFFPFRDGLDVLAAAGVASVVQPGGSVRDEELVAAADEHGMAMVLTAERHFRH